MGSAAHLGLLVLQQPQQLLLLLIVLGPSVRENVDEGAGVRDLHGQPDGSHAHLRAVPSALQHTVKDVARALTPQCSALLGSQQDPTQDPGRICSQGGIAPVCWIQPECSQGDVMVPQGHAWYRRDLSHC